MSKNKKFDSVEMKHQIQQKIHVETKGMTWEEERDHFQKDIQSSPLADKWARIRSRQDKKKAS